MRIRLGVALLLGACALQGCKKTVTIPPGPDGGREVTIKVKEPAVGEVREVSSTSTERIETSLFDMTGAAEGKTVQESTTTFAYKETILEKGPEGGRPTRLRREYAQAERRVGGKTQKFPFANMIVLIEK